MAKITISNLRGNAIIGTLPHERIRRQELILTVEFDYDARAAASGDDLMASVDYSAVEKCVMQCVEKSSFFLLEALAAEIAGEVLNCFAAIERFSITIAKPGASSCGELISYSEEFFPEKKA